MTTFIQAVSTAVISNAQIVDAQYAATGLSLDTSLTTPWSNAAVAMKQFGEDAAIDMNAWTTGSGFIASYSTDASGLLTSPWINAEIAAETFETNVGTALDNVYYNVRSNVVNSVAELKKVQNEIDKINSTTIKPRTIDTDTYDDSTTKKSSTWPLSWANYVSSETEFTVNDKNMITDSTGKEYYLIGDGTYEGYYVRVNSVSHKSKNKATMHDGTYLYKKYAKGTTGTTKDEWAITDEPEFGDELVLIPNAAGNISYMRKGTAVIPADISENLMKLGMQDPSQMMASSIIKPSLNNVVTNNNIASLSFDSLVHIDNCDESSIDKVKQIVNDSLNKFAKNLNYSLKKVGAY